jgi:hypothetical protein
MMSQIIFIYGYPLDEDLSATCEYYVDNPKEFDEVPIWINLDNPEESLYDVEEMDWNEAKVSSSYSGVDPVPYWIGCVLKKRTAYGNFNLDEIYTSLKQVLPGFKADLDRALSVLSEKERAELQSLYGDPGIHIVFGTT